MRFLAVGVMSGTSCDGIDLCLCRVERGAVWEVSPLRGMTRPYTPAERQSLASVMQDTAGQACVGQKHVELGRSIAAHVLEFLREAGVSPAEIDFIASHVRAPPKGDAFPHPPAFSRVQGHTTWHDPPRSTRQIGDGSTIAFDTGITTVCDFRMGDVAASGEGAPLAPRFDQLCLLPKATEATAFLNLGGIANVTLGGGGEPLLAMDTGPANCFIDWCARELAGQDFDDDGRLASSGSTLPGVLREALAHPFFARRAPKSTGRETFHPAFFQAWLSAGAAGDKPCAAADALATATELTAVTVVQAIGRECAGDGGDAPVRAPPSRIVVSGGGARNSFLLSRLGHHARDALGPHVTVSPAGGRGGEEEAEGQEADMKEAMLFALLGALCLCGEPGNVPSCTGARGPAQLGKICPSRNWLPLVAKLSAGQGSA